MKSHIDWGRYLSEEFKPNSVNLSDQYLSSLMLLALPIEGIRIPGWNMLNSITGGFRPNEFTIYCGPPGIGKTTLLVDWIASLAQEKIRSYVLPIETGTHDVVAKMMSHYAKRDMNQGEAIPAEVLSDFDQKFGSIFSSNVVSLGAYDRRLSVELLCSEIAYHVKHYGAKIAIVDNLNYLLNTNNVKNPNQVQDEVMQDLISFVKAIPVHVIMVMHSRKSQEGDGRVKSMEDIKGSKTAIDEAQNVLIVNDPDPTLLKSGKLSKLHREITFAKLRYRGMLRNKKLFVRYENGSYVEDSTT